MSCILRTLVVLILFALPSALFGQAEEYQLLAQGRAVEARERAQAALPGLERRYGAQSIEAAEYQRVIGLALMMQGYVAEGLEKMEFVLRVYEERLKPNDLRIARQLITMSVPLSERGQIARARAMLTRAEVLYQQPTTDTPLVHALRLNMLISSQGNLSSQLGRPAEALRYHMRSLELLQKFAHEPYAQIVIPSVYTNIADHYMALGMYDAAAACWDWCLRNDKDPTSTISLLSRMGIARAKHAQGHYQESEKWFKETMALAAQKHSAHWELRVAYGNLLLDLERPAEAETMFRQGGNEIEGDDNSPQWFGVLNGLGRATLVSQPEMSRKAFHHAYNLAERLAPGVHPEGAAAKLGLARLDAVAGNVTATLQQLTEARQILRRYIQRSLSSLSDYEQLQFLDVHEQKSLHAALRLARKWPQEQAAIEQAATWVLNSKGLAQQSLAQRTLAARENTNPALASVLDELQAVRYRLARLSFSPEAGVTPAAIQMQRKALTDRELVLMQKLGAANAAQPNANPWVELSEVRAALPQDTVLVEYARLAADKKDPQSTASYLVWLIPPEGQGTVQWFELPNSAGIAAAVTAARAPLLEVDQRLKQLGEAAAEAELRSALAEVATRVITPLAEPLAKFKHWVICPDSELWLVPWAALPSGKAKYLIEDHTLSLVVSGRELPALKTALASGNPPLVVADPDFDLPPAAQENELKKQNLLAFSTRNKTPQTKRGSGMLFPQLAGTRLEAEALLPTLRQYVESEPAVLLGPNALETTVKQLYQPRVAVFSTHGFLLTPDPKTGSYANPLLLTGLALAGANRPPATGDDGLLTGLEIVGTDLRGTELVVLSACETGLGQVRAGEGVAGLRQAFQLAGAQSVLASLWSVPDLETAQLMTAFYDNLRSSRDKAIALQTAQRDLLAVRRHKTGGAAHPFYWAAFTLTGAWQAPQIRAKTASPTRVAPLEEVEVAYASADIMNGKERLARLVSGEKLQIVQEKEGWLLVHVPGESRTGWILKAHTRAVGAQP